MKRINWKKRYIALDKKLDKLVEENIALNKKVFLYDNFSDIIEKLLDKKLNECNFLTEDEIEEKIDEEISCLTIS